MKDYKQGGKDLIKIFKEYDKSAEQFFIKKLSKWCKEWENEDIPVIIDDSYPDIIANIDFSLKTMRVDFTGIRIGRELFSKINKPALAAGFLNELQAYKVFKQEPYIKYMFYIGLYYSETASIITVLTASLTLLSFKLSLILKYALGSLVITLFIETFMLYYSNYKLRSKEYTLNIKYGLYQEVIDYYKQNVYLMKLRQSKLYSLSSITNDKIREVITNHSVVSNDRLLCSFLNDVIYKTDDPIITKKARTLQLETCKEHLQEKKLSRISENIRQLIEILQGKHEQPA